MMIPYGSIEWNVKNWYSMTIYSQDYKYIAQENKIDNTSKSTRNMMIGGVKRKGK